MSEEAKVLKEFMGYSWDVEVIDFALQFVSEKEKPIFFSQEDLCNAAQKFKNDAFNQGRKSMLKEVLAMIEAKRK